MHRFEPACHFETFENMIPCTSFVHQVSQGQQRLRPISFFKHLPNGLTPAIGAAICIIDGALRTEGLPTTSNQNSCTILRISWLDWHEMNLGYTCHGSSVLNASVAAALEVSKLIEEERNIIAKSHYPN